MEPNRFTTPSLLLAATEPAQTTTSRPTQPPTPVSVQLWDMQNRVPVAQWVGHTGSLVGLSWSPDGAWLASVAEDDVVLVWKR